MKYLMVLTVGVCLLIGTVPAMADQAADEAAIRKTVEQMYAALNKHDAKAYVALCHESFEGWAGQMKGKVALEKYLTTDVFDRQPDIKWKFLEEIGVVFMTPDVAIYKGRDEARGRLDTDGKPLSPGKRLMARVFVKKNGQWLQAAYFGRTVEE